MRRACVPYPIIIDDVHYVSMFQAAIDTGLSYKTVWFKIAERNGAPVSARGFKLCSEEWWQTHQAEWEEYLNSEEKLNGHKHYCNGRKTDPQCRNEICR